MNAAASTFGKALVLTASGLLATANLALASQPAASGGQPTTMSTADYTITYTCTAGPGCALGTGYPHTYTLSIDLQGAISGSGTQTGYPEIQENVNGSLAFNTATRTRSLNYVSTYDGLWFVSYTITESGTTDLSTGALNGIAKASMPGHPEMDAEFSVTGVRTSLTLGCFGPGNSINACGHSQAASHSQSANFTTTPTAPGQLARINGTPANANTKAESHQPRGHKTQ